MEQMKNKNTFLVACVSCIVLLLTICYFGINTSLKGTYSATTYYCANGTDAVEFNGTHVCVNDGFNFVVGNDGSGVCEFSSSTDLTGSVTGVTCGDPIIGADFSETYSCSKNVTAVDNYCLDAASATVISDTFTVFYNAMGGVFALSETIVADGEDYTVPDDVPFKSGYVFTHWNTVSDGSGDEYYPGETFGISDDIILYAQYSKTYSISYNINGGTSFDIDICTTNNICTDYVLVGDKYKIPTEVPVLAGKVFTHWNTMPDGSGNEYYPGETLGISDDIILYAQWSDYSLSLSEKTGMVYNGSAQTANTATTNANDTISYWYYTDSSCTVQTSVQSPIATGGAPADAGNYYVKAKLDNLGIYSACVPHTIAPKSVAVTWGSNTSFTYNGKAQGPTAGVSTGVSGENMTVSATTATVVGSHTSTASCSSVTGGRAKCSNYSLTNKTKSFAIVAASSDEDDETTKTFTGDFYNYDGSSKVATKTCTTSVGGTSCSMPIPTGPTRTGYTFTGWGTSKNCTSGKTSAFTVNASDSYYACYTETVVEPDVSVPDITVFKATFDANTGTLNGDKTAVCGTSGTSCKITDLPTATKSGYTFTGWGTSSSCTSGNKSSLTLTKNTTYYACYTKNAVTTPDNNQNVNTNPTTGDIAIAITWFVGLLAVGYSFYYFKSVKQN